MSTSKEIFNLRLSHVMDNYRRTHIFNGKLSPKNTLVYDSEWGSEVNRDIKKNGPGIIKGDMSRYMKAQYKKCMDIYYDKPDDFVNLFKETYKLFFYYRYYPSKLEKVFNINTKKLIYYFIYKDLTQLADELNDVYKNSLSKIK